MSTRSARVGKYVSELLVIVLGILIALGVDSWNDGRQDRIRESQYLDRLSADLRQDTALLSFTLQRAERKTSALILVDQALGQDIGVALDTLAFLRAVLESTELGWQTPALMRATFDDLLSTGNLRLIRSTTLRDRMSAYYRFLENVYQRLDRRRGEYPQLVYRLVPRSPDSDGDEFSFAPESTDRSMAYILQSLRASSMQELIIGEQNLASFLVISSAEMQKTALDLLAELEAR